MLILNQNLNLNDLKNLKMKTLMLKTSTETKSLKMNLETIIIIYLNQILLTSLKHSQAEDKKGNE